MLKSISQRGLHLRALVIALSITMIFPFMPVSTNQTHAAPVWDAPPARVAQNTDSSLVDIKLTGFKGGRNEYFKIDLQEPIVPGKFDYVMDVDMKQFPASDRCFFVKPVAYDPNSTFIINGVPCDFNVPYKFEIPAVTFGNPTQTTVCAIQVTSGDGKSTSNYTLTVRSHDLYDKVKVAVLEENLPKNGVYQFTSIDGFTTSEDSFMFVGADRAILFDALNSGGDGARRGGDLKAEIYKILKDKFGVASADLDDFPIDVVITHNHGDHVGMLNPNVGSDLMLSGRGAGKGTVYWPLKDANAISNAFFNKANPATDTDIKMVIDGDIIQGPDFGEGPLMFECLEVSCHTNGSMTYLYDNDADGQCEDNYLIVGDAISSGSYVFNFGAGKVILPVFSRDMEKLWNRVKGLDGLYDLAPHSWQEHVLLKDEAGKSLVEDMYIASKIALDNPFAGEFTTNSATAYLRKLSYGIPGLWYNDYGVFDHRTGKKIPIDSASMLSLILAAETPKSNLIPSLNPVTTAYNVTASAGAIYLFAEAFGEDADITVNLNGKAVNISSGGLYANRAYRLDVLASGDAALAAPHTPVGFNVVNIRVADPASKISRDYIVNIRTENDNTAYPLPDISADVFTIPTQPSLNIPSGESTLNDIKISSFKGGRLEPYRILLDEPVDVMTWAKRDFTVTMDWGSRTSKVVYIAPETTNPNASYTINGEACSFPIPYRYELKEGANVLTIVVGGTTTYTLTINAVPLWDQYQKEEIEEGVWRIQDAKGFVGNDDMYLFVGSDKAMLFDTGMGEGDLRAYVEEIIGDPSLPIEVVVTHAHPDHYGKVAQFSDCKVYWPEKESPAIPVAYNTSKYVYTKDGGIIIGPKFNGSAINFECIEVTGHTPGSMLYLYDNIDQGLLGNSYLVTGDAVSSGSYVFNFGTNKPPVSIFLRDLKKLEAKIAKFADDFYDPEQEVDYNNVFGLYFMCGHSWQETAAMQVMYEPSWEVHVPMQHLAGIQMIRDMRIAAENVVSGDMKGLLTTRLSGGVVEELRQLDYRQAGLWYNGWDVVPAPASLDYLEVFSTSQNRGLVRPNFNAYTTEYTAAVNKGETLKVWATSINPSATVRINGTTVSSRSEVSVNDLTKPIVVAVTEGNSTRTYNVVLQVSDNGSVTPPPPSGSDLGSGSGNSSGSGTIPGYVPPTSSASSTPSSSSSSSSTSGDSPTVSGSTGSLSGFSDVTAVADWAVSYFDRLIMTGVLSGYSDGTLRPKANVTRAEFIKLVVSGLNLKAGNAPKSFAADVGAGDWFKEFVDIASSLDVINGVSVGTFAPNANITRQDLSAIVYRILVYLNLSIPASDGIRFIDDGAIADYAKDAVYVLKQLNIVSGRTDGSFDPLAFATREETAKIISGVIDYVASSEAASKAAADAQSATTDAQSVTADAQSTTADTQSVTAEVSGSSEAASPADDTSASGQPSAETL